MVTKNLTPEVCDRLSEQILSNEFETMNIRRRETGRYKGIYFAEYTYSSFGTSVKSPTTDQIFAASLLKEVGYHLSLGHTIDELIFKKEDQRTPYAVKLSVKE